ncbi:leucine-rich repeat-containing protein 72 [Engystomops pustulosus]|uniref:leucine-rich repeat-containing protein 72 n=1 Tax=Engystomops pustulosus TaxID=76066 RepID=UPI003AFAD3F1
MAAKIIEEQIHKCRYKTNSDVYELYLGRRDLRDVPDLSRFRLLKYLWLNHNKISKINFLGQNFRLTELYLNSNEIGDITGCVKHLTSLHTLMLNDNHLTDLPSTVKELKAMTSLRVLNLFHNPLEQDPSYRHTVVHRVPSVQLLDREQVTQKERQEAFHLFHPHRTAVIQSLGFGRRTDSVLSNRPVTQSPTGHSSSKILRNSAATSKSERYDALSLEERLLLRGYDRSVMRLSLFDWNMIPSSRLRRSEERSVEAPRLITVEFR